MTDHDHIEKLNTLWSSMMSSGMTDALTNIEQLSMLIFLKRLDSIQLRKEANAFLFEIEVENPVFDAEHNHCRWNVFKDYPLQKLYSNMSDHIIPFLRYDLVLTKETLYAKYMRQITLRFHSSLLLKSAIDTIDTIDTDNNDIANEVYEYFINQLKPEYAKGQCTTPAYLIDICVALTTPGIQDKICDPAAGCGNMLAAAARYISKAYSSELFDQSKKNYYNTELFTGIDYDANMISIAAMNMIIHGVEDSNLLSIDALSPTNTYTDEYSVVLSHLPFSTTVDVDHISESLYSGPSTSNTAVFFFRLAMRMLKSNGRCALIIPDILLFGVQKAPIDLKADLLDNHCIEAIIALNDPQLKYLNNVSCSIIVFTKDIPEGTNEVWFYNLTSADQAGDLIRRFHHKDAERTRSRYDNSFIVPKHEILNNNYMLIMNRYQKDISLSVNDPKSALLDLELANSILKQTLYKLSE